MQRIRPKIMTVSAILFGLLPIMWSPATQAGARCDEANCYANDRWSDCFCNSRVVNLSCDLRTLAEACIG